MTFKQFELAYNFHDCDVFMPFEINGDSVTVIFDLAKHLQYDHLKSHYGDLLQIEDNSLIVKARFSNCSNIQANEWEQSVSKKTRREERCNEKTILAEQFDSDMDFISLAVLGENKICFTFEKCGKQNKLGEIQFTCQDIDIIEEKIYTKSEYEDLWNVCG